MNIPAQIVSGDSVKWCDNSQLGDLGASINSTDYSLTYALRGAAAPLDVVGVADGTGWEFTVAYTDTVGWPAGVYYWQATAAKGDERVTVGQGTFSVLANIASQVGTFDGRSAAEIDLAAVETEIRNRVAGGASIEYSIGNRSLKREPLSELRALRADFKRIVIRERQAQSIAQGKGNPRNVFVSFGSPLPKRP